jgi:two-component system, NtrC family, sensor kinase
MVIETYRRLHWKIIVISLAFSLIPIVGLGIVMHEQFTRSCTNKSISNLRSLIENKKMALDLFLEERVGLIKTLANIHNLDQFRNEPFLEGILEQLQANTRSFVDVGVINEQGEHVAYVGPYPLKQMNYKNEEWFHEVLFKGVYVSDIFLGFRNHPHLIIAVLRREGSSAWILRASIDPTTFNTLAGTVQVGDKGDAYLVNRDGILQTPGRFAGPALSRAAPAPVSRFSGSRIEELTLDGRTLLAGTTWLSQKDWLLVVLEDLQDEMHPLFRARSTVLFLIVAGIALITTGTVLTTRSITGKLIEAEREKKILDAGLMQSSKLTTLGKMASGVAHEINNPLTMIMESAGWMKDLMQDEDKFQSRNLQEFAAALEDIEVHVERAKAVTHRLLGFARRMEPVHEPVDLNQVADQTIAFLRNEAVHRDIKIIKEYDPGLPPTYSDRSQLQQVILNILDNAIDAIGKDGTITLGTGLDQDGSEVFLSISDTGTGIPKDKLATIFDPFFTTKKVGEGTGLGLAIVFGIMEKLGGRIEVKSEEGKGSTFTITLPLVQNL